VSQTDGSGPGTMIRRRDRLVIIGAVGERREIGLSVKVSQGSKETLARGEGHALVHSERRLYETNEETSTPIRNGVSD
jgi:hypothetical protein